MKIYYLVILILIVGLSSPSCTTICPSNDDVVNKVGSVVKPNLILQYEDRVVAKFTRHEYEKVLQLELPEIVHSPGIHPDSLYDSHAIKTLNYGSEQGKDVFCFLYSTYFSEKYPDKEKLRKKLLDVFYSINWIYIDAFNYEHAPNHMHLRIPAYAEYELLKANVNAIDTTYSEVNFESLLKSMEPALTKIDSELRNKTIVDLKNSCASNFVMDAASRFIHGHYSHFK